MERRNCCSIPSISSEERVQYRDFLVSRIHSNKPLARAQANLVMAGYDLGTYGTHGVDGKQGPLTARAIKSFQESIGLKPTGELDQETSRALDLMTKLGMTKREIEGMGKKLVVQSEEQNFEGKEVILNQNLYNGNKLYKHEADLITKINSIDSKFTWDINNFKKIYEKNKELYQDISEETGIPPELIAALHYRESGCNFSTYFHNGDPLGKPTIHVPVGKNFSNFKDAAVDALLGKAAIRDKYGLSSYSNDIAAMMAFAESYNGLGYFNKGMVSPYVFSGTNVYEKGKYIADGTYDPNTIDAQPGVYILITALKK